jgi:hypothetical protein
MADVAKLTIHIRFPLCHKIGERLLGSPQVGNVAKPFTTPPEAGRNVGGQSHGSRQ